MGREGQDTAAGKHIHYVVHDTAAATDNVRAVVREGVDLVLSARLDPEQLTGLVASLKEAVDAGTSVQEVPAVQAIPGLEAWAKRNPALFVLLVGVLGALIGVLGTWSLEQLKSDPVPTQVEVTVNQEAPRPTAEEMDEQINRVIEDKLREYQQEPPSSEQPSG